METEEETLTRVKNQIAQEDGYKTWNSILSGYQFSYIDEVAKLYHSERKKIEQSKKTDFQVMHEMSVGNMDIALCPDFLEAKTASGGGKVIFGVPREVIDKLIMPVMRGAKQTHYATLYIVNVEQFERIKKS